MALGRLDFLNTLKERLEKSIKTYDEQKKHINGEHSSMTERLDKAIMMAKEELAMVELMREEVLK